MAHLSVCNKLTICVILDQLCFAMLIVVLFPHFNSLGATQLYIGLISSLMSLIALIWNPIIGSLSDSYGRKTILMRLLTVSAISTILLLSNSLGIIFFARMLASFGGPLPPILNSLASEILEKDDKDSYYGRIPTFMAINMIVGSMMGGFISGFNNGYFVVYTLIFIFILTNAWVVSTLPDSKQTTNKEQESLPLLKIAQRELKSVVTKLTKVNWNDYSEIFTAKLCIECSCSMFYTSIGPAYIGYGYKDGALGVVFTVMSVGAILTSISLGYMKKTVYAEDTFGRKRLYHATVLLVLTALILSFSNSVVTYSAGILVISIARTIADGTFTEALMVRISDEDRGGVSGAFESIVSFCQLIMPVSAGILTDLYGVKFILKLSIIPTLVGLAFTYSDYNKQKKQN